jgi:hypothetical protein
MRGHMACKPKHDDKMRSHYDFSDGVRGKYAARYDEATRAVVLAPDVKKMFRDSVGVDDALRTLLRVSAKIVTAKAARKK